MLRRSQKETLLTPSLGFPFSYGVFQDYYTNSDLFGTNPSGIAIIGTSASGIMYLSAPLIFSLLASYPIFRRISSILGLVIITIALVASSFSNAVWHLIITQGILYAIGGSLLYSPAILYLDEWFIKRKGMAFGVMWAGTGCSGIVVPFIMEWGLEKYGFRTMLRSWAVTLIILASPLIYYVKPRIPPSKRGAGSSTPKKVSWAFLKTPTFWLLQGGNILEGLGFFIPTIYLPSYARSLNLPSTTGSLTLALFNTTSVLGQVGFGILIDRLHVTTVILISTLGATLSVLLLWGMGTGVPVLIVFALMYGVFGGGFTSTYTGVIKEVQRKTPSAETGTIFGLLAAGRGIGAVVSGPISEKLLGAMPWEGHAKLGYGTGYGGLIVFTGITALFGGVSFLGRTAKFI
jgi:MFS family permease